MYELVRHIEYRLFLFLFAEPGRRSTRLLAWLNRKDEAGFIRTYALMKAVDPVRYQNELAGMTRSAQPGGPHLRSV